MTTPREPSSAASPGSPAAGGDPLATASGEIDSTTRFGTGTSTEIEAETDAETYAEMRTSDPSFPTLAEVAISPMSSNIRKAQVRAALFHKLEPVKVARFTLLERLGAGSMGEIYAAYDEQLDRAVALKLVRHGSDHTIKGDELLLREAQALAQVSHPNVVQIYEAGTHDGRLFIAMELIRGQTLTSWLDDAARLPRPHRQREILRQFIAAGRGLEAAHAAGVAHRDFKPDNVLVGKDSRVCVADFGLARVLVDDPTLRLPASGAVSEAQAAELADIGRGETLPLEFAGGPAPQLLGPPARLTAATRLTRTGTVMGTPRFMAPEQIRGGVPDHRSDQFSFCVALYHALYGAFPFSGERPNELLDSIETGVTGLEHSVGLGKRLRKALCRGLSVEPSQRFANMGELLAALEPGLRRRRGWIAGAVLLLFFAVAAVYFWTSPPADVCGRAGEAIDTSWSAERQAVVQAGFTHSDLPYADTGWSSTKRRIDDYAARWRGEAAAACRATYVDHTQSEQQHDRRMLCIERGNRALTSLVTELAAGSPEAVQHAVETAESLPDLGACSHTENLMFGLEPPPRAVAPEVEVVRDKLARAQTLEQFGRTEESLALARDARTAAERLKYQPVRAEALVQVARALDRRENAEARREAEGLYFEALDIAEAERHDQLAAVIWSRLVQLTLQMDSGTELAHERWRRNAAAVRRIGASPRDEAMLHHLLGEIDYSESKYSEAADEQSLAIAAMATGGQPLELARYYAAHAKALDPLGRVDESVRLYERAQRSANAVLGPSHPDAIKLQLNYGHALQQQGRHEQARAVYDAALASMPVKYLESSIDAGVLYAYQSDLAYLDRRLDEAAAYGHRALDIYQRIGAPAHRRAEAYINIANAEMRGKHFEDALAMYTEALALRRSLAGNHLQICVNEGSIADALVALSRFDEAIPHVVEAERILAAGSARLRGHEAWLLTVHGRALLGLQQSSAAVDALERAVSLYDGAADPAGQATAMWALARALHALGRDPARVRQLAENALAQFATVGPQEEENAAAVEQFLGAVSAAPASSIFVRGHSVPL